MTLRVKVKLAKTASRPPFFYTDIDYLCILSTISHSGPTNNAIISTCIAIIFLNVEL